MNNKLKAIFLSALLIGLLFSCSKEDPGEFPYEKLSSYGFFVGDMKDLNPREDILPYDINTPLFSDYAHKARFVYVPENVTVQYNETEAFDFPTGSILIKDFYFPEDFRNPDGPRKIVETRLLVRQEAGWDALTYIWNDQQTEAFLSIVGEQQHISWIDEQGNPQSTGYIIPNKNDCKGCHSLGNEFVPLGPKARHLNKNFDYKDGTKNQLEKWEETGILTGFTDPANSPKVAVWNDSTSGSVEERARAYLDINCAHCHNPDGPANNSGLSLGWYVTNPTALGICKPPVAAGQGSGGLQYGIVPGQPDQSIMVYRMNSVEPDVEMPELGKTMIHKEGVALIRQWIAGMSGSCN